MKYLGDSWDSSSEDSWGVYDDPYRYSRFELPPDPVPYLQALPLPSDGFLNNPQFLQPTLKDGSLPALINTISPPPDWLRNEGKSVPPPVLELDSSEASPDDIPRNTRVMDSLSESDEDVSWRTSKEIPIPISPTR